MTIQAMSSSRAPIRWLEIESPDLAKLCPPEPGLSRTGLQLRPDIWPPSRAGTGATAAYSVEGGGLTHSGRRIYKPARPLQTGVSLSAPISFVLNRKHNVAAHPKRLEGFLWTPPILFAPPAPALRAWISGRQKALRKAERELDAAITRTAINAAVKRMMLAKAELKRLERKAPTRQASCVVASSASS
jgi:hypothetical protein